MHECNVYAYGQASVVCTASQDKTILSPVTAAGNSTRQEGNSTIQHNTAQYSTAKQSKAPKELRERQRSKNDRCLREERGADVSSRTGR